MRVYSKLIAGYLIMGLWLILALTGCDLGQSPEKKAKMILDDYTEQMIACYASTEQSNTQKCREQLVNIIYEEIESNEIAKELFEKVLRTWEEKCKNRTDARRYSIYILRVRGTNNPLEDKISENLEKQGFNAGCLESDSVEAIANKFSVPADELEWKNVALLYHQDTIKFITEKIKNSLQGIPEVSEVKMIEKDNEYIYSFGIYVPAV